jgi:hypothetical protein
VAAAIGANAPFESVTLVAVSFAEEVVATNAPDHVLPEVACNALGANVPEPDSAIRANHIDGHVQILENAAEEVWGAKTRHRVLQLHIGLFGR